MIPSIDESELIDLIEGQLDARRAESLLRRLQADPKAMALIERLRSDRRALAALPQPPLPVDFVAELEPMLARPMLMQISPEEFRRRARRRPNPWRRWAAVAAVLVVAAGGLWAGALGLGLWPSAPQAPGVARRDGERDVLSRPAPRLDGVAPGASPPGQPWPPEHGSIHHRAPRSLVHAATETVPGRAADRPPAGARPGIPDALVEAKSRIVPSDIAIVLRGSDPALIEASLAQAMRPVEGDAALVQNFSYEEARRLEAMWIAQATQRADRRTRAEPVLMEADGLSPAGRSAALQSLTDRIREQLQLAIGQDPEQHRGSGHIMGPRRLAPSLEQQLDYSSRGASHTLAVPAGVLPDLLARVMLKASEETRLALLPASAPLSEQAPSVNSGRAGMESAIAARERLRHLLDEQLRAGPDAVLLLPVIFELSDD
jgi:hypothetical protein